MTGMRRGEILLLYLPKLRFSIAFCGSSCYIWLASLENVLHVVGGQKADKPVVQEGTQIIL